jgi:hypothetical protein
LQLVAINSRNPPLQIYRIHNLGNYPQSYSIDDSSLQDLRQSNCNFSVLQLLSPLSGQIQAGESSEVQMLFQPLEAKTYEAELVFKNEQGRETKVLIVGEGSSQTSNKRLPDSDFSAVPRAQLLTNQRQLASLSTERLHFGHVPFDTIHRGVVVIRNHKACALSFTWNFSAWNKAKGNSYVYRWFVRRGVSLMPSK